MSAKPTPGERANKPLALQGRRSRRRRAEDQSNLILTGATRDSDLRTDMALTAFYCGVTGDPHHICRDPSKTAKLQS